MIGTGEFLGLLMADDGHTGIRAARRSDLPALADLRMRYLGEAAHEEPRLRLLAEARPRTEQALPVWMGQEDCILLVALGPRPPVEKEASGTTEEIEVTEEDPEGVPVGYAMGVLHTWPPVLERQRGGEVVEIYVLPESRGRGLGRGLVQVLTQVLRGRGAQVLRAALPIVNEVARSRLRAAGYEPLQVVMERRLDAL